jgi:hypothetical protein
MRYKDLENRQNDNQITSITMFSSGRNCAAAAKHCGVWLHAPELSSYEEYHDPENSVPNHHQDTP